MRVVRVLWMRFTFLVVIFLSGSIYADDKIYEWMLKQYEAKNETIIDNQVDVNIDGEPHFVIVARDVDAERDADTSTDKQYLGVFKKIQGKFVSVALARLTDVGYQEYPIAEIKNNAIFLMTTYCHHGCYYKRYQFKKINQRLKLVGFELLSTTLFYDFAGIDNYLALCEHKEANCNFGVAYGNSYNYLTSTSICWLDITPMTEAEAKPDRVNQYQPRGVQHKMLFKKTPLKLLDGFDTNTYSPPKSCNFDYRKKLNLSTP